MTDWNAFLPLATQITHHYSDSDLKRCLVYLDSKALEQLTLKDRLLMRTGATTSKWVRDACFAKVFRFIKQAHPDLFLQAPPEAINAYNTLIDSLFSDDVAQELHVADTVRRMTPALPVAELPFDKRLALFLQKSSMYDDLHAQANGVSDIQMLQELEKECEARQKTYALLQLKEQKLALLIQNLPKEAPAYLQPIQHPEKWQQLYEIVQPFYALPQTQAMHFSDKEAFLAWADDEEEKFMHVLKAASILALVKALEKPMQDFKAYAATLPAYLHDAHAAAFGSIIEEQMLEGQEEEAIVAGIQKQKERLQEIEHFQIEQKEAVKLKTAPFMNKLFTPDFMAFTDLPAEVNRIVLLNFEPKALDALVLTDESVNKYKEDVSHFYDNRILQLENLVTAAHQRQESLSEISKFSRDFVAVTEPLKGFKDIHEDYTALSVLVKNLSMDRHQFVKDGYADNEQKLSSHYQEYLQIKANMPKTLDTLLAKAKMAEIQAQDSKAAIKRRLFEIFWNISPYLDLMEDFQDMRKLLTEQLSEAMHKFYSGDLSAHELLEVCQEMPYEHDVVKLRNEITHRSGRLKDLRDELLRLLKELEQAKLFLEIIEARDETAYKNITACLTQISSILAEVENPFKAFKKAETKDDINYVFRNFWIQIEGVQTQIESALNSSLPLLQNGAPTLEKAFLQALDTLEEVLMAKNGTRTQLVVPAERQLRFSAGAQLYSAVISALHGVEKSYPFVEPYALFMGTNEHQTRLKMMQEADVLDARIAETIEFAKAMQYVKTFEEERVDIILEAFERQHVIEEQDWSLYVMRLHRACRLVEDEIFLDIGLLDRHALMDVDVQELNHALIIATNRAVKHIYEPHYGVLADLETVTLTEPLCQKTLSDCKKSLEAWAKVSVDDIKNTDWLLMHLRKYCHHLFDAKILVGTQDKILLPKCLDFVCDLRSLEKYIRAAVQAKRNQHEAEWGHPWITECHDIREEIESFEQDEESEDAFRPLLKKIYSIAEKIPEVDLSKLETFQQELERHLKEIDELKMHPQKDYPFIYIPGYLAFFSLRGKQKS